jgi:hypothetical protein
MSTITYPRRAAICSAISLMVGLGYFLYLRNESFPPALAGFVPFIWLALAVIGVWQGTEALRSDTAKSVAVLSIVAAIVSGIFATFFSIAAVFGG